MIGTYEGWVAKCDSPSCKSEVRGKSKHTLVLKLEEFGWEKVVGYGERVLCHGCAQAAQKRRTIHVA